MSKDTIEQFMKDVAQFDWYYEFSDDHSVYERGTSAEYAMTNRAHAGGDDFKRHWNQQHAARYNTPQFCGPYRPPFPEVWPADAIDNTHKK